MFSIEKHALFLYTGQSNMIVETLIRVRIMHAGR